MFYIDQFWWREKKSCWEKHENKLHPPDTLPQYMMFLSLPAGGGQEQHSSALSAQKEKLDSKHRKTV